MTRLANNHPLYAPWRLIVIGSRLMLALWAMSGAVACKAKVNGATGTFTFLLDEEYDESNLLDEVREVGKNVELSFVLEEPCGCSEVVFVQATRATLGNGEHIQSHVEQTNRMEPDGWAIDKHQITRNPWFQLRDDGTARDEWGTTGRDGVAAILRDKPRSRENSWPVTFEFLTYAVCRRSQGEKCTNQVLKGAYWSFKVTAEGNIIDAEFRKPSDEELVNYKDAVDEWNRDSDATGNRVIPDLKYPIS